MKEKKRSKEQKKRERGSKRGRTFRTPMPSICPASTCAEKSPPTKTVCASATPKKQSTLLWMKRRRTQRDRREGGRERDIVFLSFSPFPLPYFPSLSCVNVLPFKAEGEKKSPRRKRLREKETVGRGTPRTEKQRAERERSPFAETGEREEKMLSDARSRPKIQTCGSHRESFHSWLALPRFFFPEFFLPCQSFSFHKQRK
jgi:hypothetical protein